MLCRACHRQLPRRDAVCSLCGTPRRGSEACAHYGLVLPDGTRTPVSGELKVGRGDGNTLRLEDPAVSRRHLRIRTAPGGVDLEDLGSGSGTFVDGHRIRGCVRARDGQRLRVGDTHLRIERDRGAGEAGRTVVVPVGASLRVPLVGAATLAVGAAVPVRPRLRSGWALKRLAGSEGTYRYVLADLRSDRFLRFPDREAELIELLDGSRTLPQLTTHVHERYGSDRLPDLAALLADLGDEGLLAGSDEGLRPGARLGRLGALLRPRAVRVDGLRDHIDRLYRAAGFVLFTRAAFVVLALVAVAGGAAFVGILTAGSARPLHVNHGVTLGAAAFLLGRCAVVALHELGHGLTLASFGRRARSVGVKVLLVFPYAFVDTSEAWFEPRRRRLAVSAAGPVTDGVLAGLFSLLAYLLGGTARDVAFQLALGAYAGMLLNLNPLLERDGYHMLVDALDEPNLRRRAREEVERRIARRPCRAPASQAVAAYGVAALAWSFVAAAFVTVAAIALVNRLGDRVGWPLWPLASVAAALALAPPALVIARGLRGRRHAEVAP
jgi:putative peptide zinc metalloprotease protein